MGFNRGINSPVIPLTGAHLGKSIKLISYIYIDFPSMGLAFIKLHHGAVCVLLSLGNVRAASQRVCESASCKVKKVLACSKFRY